MTRLVAFGCQNPFQFFAFTPDGRWNYVNLRVEAVKLNLLCHTASYCTLRQRTKGFEKNNLGLAARVSYGDESLMTGTTWHEGIVVHKVYLSAILDLYDRRIVAYVVSDRNDNPLVFKTLDRAVVANPGVHPLFHSDRGFQYTNRVFHQKLEKAGMAQSMSRVGRCIDNGPMEGFWGILKRERYYGKRFTSKKELVDMIVSYIRYYNNRRVQRILDILTPMETYNLYIAA